MRRVARRFETLEHRRLLAFRVIEQQVLVSDVDLDGTRAIFAADLDGDGNQDVLAATVPQNGDEGALMWFRNQGRGDFQRRRTIESTSTVDVIAVDVDGDKDLDVVASNTTGTVWYENDGFGQFGNAISISPFIGEVATADLDLDGDQDLVVRGLGRQTKWYENQAGDGFVEHVIDTDRSTSFAIVDMDRDGDVDVVLGKQSLVVSLHRNDGTGTFEEAETLVTLEAAAVHLEFGDIDRDNDLDFVVGSNQVLVFSNENGVFDRRVVPLEDSLQLPTDMSLLDLDVDGDIDLILGIRVSGVSDSVAWYPNEGGGAFADMEPLALGVLAGVQVVVSDLDNDELPDLISGGGLIPDFEGLGYQRQLSPGVFQLNELQPSRKTAIATNSDGATSTSLVDLNQDGFLDVLAVSFWDGRVSTHLYDPVQLGFGDRQLIGVEFGARRVDAGDLDDDQIPDVVVASDEGIVWWKNDGATNFVNRTVVSPTEASYVETGDFDGDGGIDLLAVIRHEDQRENPFEVVIHRNNQDGTFSTPLAVSNSRNQQSASFVDVDQDGDLDLVEMDRGEFSVYSYNSGEFQLSSTTTTLANIEFPEAPLVQGDYDGDGDLDVYQFRSTFGEILLFENKGDATFATRLIQFANVNLDSNDGMFADGLLTDWDNDGDQDVVAYGNTRIGSLAEGLPREGEELVWFENLGDWNYGKRQTIVKGVPEDLLIPSLLASDIDRNGTLDFLSAHHGRPSGGIKAYFSRIDGDANNDGSVDFADFLLLSNNFQQTDAVWADGDFDGNGVVEFADFLLLSANFGR